MSLMSDGKEMRFQVPPKTFRLDGRITQQIGQWVRPVTEKARRSTACQTQLSCCARHSARCAAEISNQYASCPGNRAHCAIRITRRFFPSGDRNHFQYSLLLAVDGWPGWVGLNKGQSNPNTNGGLDVTELCWRYQCRYCCASTATKCRC